MIWDGGGVNDYWLTLHSVFLKTLPVTTTDLIVCTMEEHDQWTERDVALDRYRRHHEYMAELFSPYSTGNETRHLF